MLTGWISSHKNMHFYRRHFSTCLMFSANNTSRFFGLISLWPCFHSSVPLCVCKHSEVTLTVCPAVPVMQRQWSWWLHKRWLTIRLLLSNLTLNYEALYLYEGNTIEKSSRPVLDAVWQHRPECITSGINKMTILLCWCELGFLFCDCSTDLSSGLSVTTRCHIDTVLCTHTHTAVPGAFNEQTL